MEIHNKGLPLIMEAILLAIAPILVSFLTQGVKMLLDTLVIFAKDDPLRTGLLRVVGAILSFLAVIFATALSGQTEVDPVAVSTLVNVIVTFVASNGVYLLLKKKQETV